MVEDNPANPVNPAIVVAVVVSVFDVVDPQEPNPGKDLLESAVLDDPENPEKPVNFWKTPEDYKTRN